MAGSCGMRPDVRQSPFIRRSRGVSVESVRAFVRMIVAHAPEELGFVQPLWNRAALRSLLAEHFGVVLPDSHVWRMLARGGLALQWPALGTADDPAWEARRSSYARIRKLAREVRADVILATMQHWLLPGAGNASQRAVTSLNAVGPYSEHRFRALPRARDPETIASILRELCGSGHTPVWLVGADHLFASPRIRELMEHSAPRMVLFELGTESVPPYAVAESPRLLAASTE